MRAQCTGECLCGSSVSSVSSRPRPSTWSTHPTQPNPTPLHALCSCLVVVGNGNGVLGWGQGKAAEVNDAVQKAYHRACRNLYPVPRYNGHTIPEAIKSKYGQVRLLLRVEGCAGAARGQRARLPRAGGQRLAGRRAGVPVQAICWAFGTQPRKGTALQAG